MNPWHQKCDRRGSCRRRAIKKRSRANHEGLSRNSLISDPHLTAVELDEAAASGETLEPG